MTNSVVNQPGVRTFCDLVIHCEIRALVCRIVSILVGGEADINQHVAPLLNPQMSDFLQNRITQAVAAIPIDQRADVLLHAVPLFPPFIRASFWYHIIEDVAAIPEAQRANF